MFTLLGLLLGRSLTIYSERSTASAAKRIRARVDLRSENLPRRRGICGDVTPKRVFLASLDPEECDWFAPVLVGKLLFDSGGEAHRSSSRFEGQLRLSSFMRVLLSTIALLCVWLGLKSSLLLLTAPTANAMVPLLLGVPAAALLVIFLRLANERAKSDSIQLEQLLRESLEAPSPPVKEPTKPSGSKTQRKAGEGSSKATDSAAA